MKNIVILGGGTAGTLLANHLVKKINKDNWHITVVDRDNKHYYQPGFLFIPFGIYKPKDVVKERSSFFHRDVTFLMEEAGEIDSANNRLRLKSGKDLPYDILVIATGSRIEPSEIPGMTEGWQKNIFDFYTYEGSIELNKALEQWKGGDLVMHIQEMPIKCPIAPLEFVFLADWWLKKKGLRDRTNLTLVTPLSGAFTKEVASKFLGNLLVKKNINVVHDFNTERVDAEQKKIYSYEGTEVSYDLMVTVPTNMGDPVISQSKIGDELDFVPTDQKTLQSKEHNNVFVIGDATNVPTSKAGAVAHFEGEVLTENILRYMEGRDLKPEFDGHANCFLETGHGKGILLDFNYDVEPLPGTFPLPGVGPLSLLKETVLNHLGKMAFKWIYWKLILKARHIPFVTAGMKLSGKKTVKKKNIKLKEKEA